MPKDEIIRTTCASHCGGTCVLRVHVRDGAVSRVETDDGAMPQLRACMRSRAYRQRMYASNRLCYPLKRTGEKGEGKFERIGWDEALDTVAGQIRHVRDTYGPASILVMAVGGDVGQINTRIAIQRLMALYGGFTTRWGVLSYGAGMYASQVTYGTHYTANNRDDLVNSRMVVLWGWDPAVTISGTNTSWYLAEARARGARIIAVDPRYTDTAAALADKWIPVRPGTDAAALNAIAYVIISENLQDQPFLDRYTLGFDKYRDYLLGRSDGTPKTPAWAEAITGMPALEIVALAREYAATKPAAFMAGIAPGRTAYGEQYHRAASVLAAMTGNVGVHGGDAAGRAWESVFGGYPFRMKSPLVVPNPLDDVPVPKGLPLDYRSSRVHFNEIADFILKGKAGGFPSDCKLAIAVNSNYVNQLSNTNKIRQAMTKLDFFVVLEQFMTPTARFADIILPTTTFLERNDIDQGMGTVYYGYVNKAVDSGSEVRSHLEIGRELAQRLGIDSFGESTEDELLRAAVKNSEIPEYDTFKSRGVFRMALPEPYVAFKNEIEDPEHHPFQTPSGKIEIYAQAWADLNNPLLPPVPKYIESWESVNDALAKKYPLQLVTTHIRRRALSQFDNVPWLRQLQRQAVTISRKDAAARGIQDGDMVRVFNDRGVIQLPAWVTERIMPGVVDVPHGAWYAPDKNGVDHGGCANVLTKDTYSPGGAFPFNTALVQVEKLVSPTK